MGNLNRESKNDSNLKKNKKMGSGSDTPNQSTDNQNNQLLASTSQKISSQNSNLLPEANKRIDLSKYPVTKKSHIKLLKMGLRFLKEFNDHLVSEATTLKRQLIEQEVNEIIKEFKKYLYDPRPDSSCPFPKIKCGRNECGVEFQPMIWNIVNKKNWTIIVYNKGPEKGKPKVQGNFTIIDGKVIPVCKEEVRVIHQIGGRTFSYAEAHHILKKINNEQKKVEFAKKTQLPILFQIDRFKKNQKNTPN